LQQLRIHIEPVESRRIRRLPLFVWIPLLAVAVVVFSASRVEATCGDYLSHHGMAGRGMAGHDQTMPDGDPAEGLPYRTPCHGPSCQQAPLQAPVSPPVVSLETQERWGWMASVEFPTLDQSSFLTRINESLALPMIAYRLDRPPKA
jgi:hypothetical protein